MLNRTTFCVNQETQKVDPTKVSQTFSGDCWIYIVAVLLPKNL